MKFFNLRKIRIFISILLLFLITAVYLDIANILSPEVINIVTYLQFIPSFLKSYNFLFTVSFGFLIVLFITILFGRVYCSSICPLGTIQDISSFIARKTRIKKYYTYSKEYFWLRYLILLITVISFLSGTLFFIYILDPYSNSGRFFAQILNPLVILVNNAIAYTIESLNIYLVYPIEIKAIKITALAFPLLFFALVIFMSFKNGRLYCNTICPVGTFLGLLSKFSLFKIKIDVNSCEGCGICATVCKAECIKKESKDIDFSRCVVCYNCLEVCPSKSISILFNNPDSSRIKNDHSRRNFISRSSFFLFNLSTVAFSQVRIVAKKQSKTAEAKSYSVSPPGSKNIEHFNNNCTACHLCISVCPTKVLQPSLTEYGLLNIFQPFMDFRTNFCNYDCVSCSEVCPTAAILPVKPEEKKKIQIGRAIFIKENCIVETEKTACGACSEHCPTKAVMMVDYKGNLKIPEVTNKYCVGCGACEFACPTKPYKAIYVDGNNVHQIAEKRPVEKLDLKIDYKEEFPF